MAETLEWAGPLLAPEQQSSRLSETNPWERSPRQATALPLGVIRQKLAQWAVLTGSMWRASLVLRKCFVVRENLELLQRTQVSSPPVKAELPGEEVAVAPGKKKRPAVPYPLEQQLRPELGLKSRRVHQNRQAHGRVHSSFWRSLCALRCRWPSGL